MTNPDEEYATIREILGGLIGKRLVDITQQDEDEWEETGEAYVMFMFEDGSFVKMPVEEGFEYLSCPADDSD